MKARAAVLFALLFFVFDCYKTNAQKLIYKDECKLLTDFLDSADHVWFTFSKIARDSAITFFDVDGVLSRCAFKSAGNVNIKIISTGEEFARIKKGGIFSAPGRKGWFVITKEYVFKDGKRHTALGIFYPNSGGTFSWALIEKNGSYHFEKQSMGWF